MDKSIKVFKFQIKTSLKSIFIYYSIFCVIIGVLAIIGVNHREFRSAGHEISTAIFMFILGLNFFRGTFYFTQGSNISRKSFIKGSIMAGGLLCAVLPIIDIVLNRIYNLFVNCAMNYDMIYGNYALMSDESGVDGIYNIVINNSIPYLLKNYLFLLAVLIFVFALGFLISTLYFRLSKIGQIVLSVIPIAVMILGSALKVYIPDGFIKFIQYAFGYTTKNSLMAVLTFIILSSLLLGGQYLLTRKAEAKK